MKNRIKRSNKQEIDVQTETRKVPVLRKPVQQSQSSSSPSSSRQSPRNPQLQSSAKEDNICMEPLHDPPKLIPRSQIPLPASLLRSLSIEDNIRMEQLQEEPGPLTRSQKPLPSLSSSPSIEDNICMEPLHDPPKLIPRSQIPLQASLLRSLSIEDNIRMEQLQEEPGPLTRSQKPLPSLSSSPSIEDIKDCNPFAEITSIDAEYTQPSKKHPVINTSDGISNQTKCLPTRFTTESISSEQPQTINHVTPISRSPPPSPPVEEDDVSSGFASFHGPGSMDQRPSIPRSIQPLLQDRLEEEDKSSCDDSSNSNSEHEDEATAIDNPSYHEKEETISSIHSSSNEETTGIEEVQQPTTNTDKKKLLQYYPTFPKKTDDDTWTEPAEPIKVLDEGETQPMELSPSLNDHNDQDKTDSTSEDKSPETEN
ncbi:uncharacterized protein [Mytilus edulis]|uniref:uncharacterized protein n=1 Tax=Mytilus edulis TaxID=6550 RepID=UPI0039F11718